MFKAIYTVTIIVGIILLAVLISIRPKKVNDRKNNSTVKLWLDTDLAEVPGHRYLSYSVNTHTVYYLVNGFMAPYIRNGHFCEYVGRQIVEVIPTVKLEDTTN